MKYLTQAEDPYEMIVETNSTPVGIMRGVAQRNATSSSRPHQTVYMRLQRGM